jgi:hypothetical protein
MSKSLQTISRPIAAAALLTAGLAASRSDAATYRVGPGRSYANLQAVAGLLNPGDVVEVDGNATYPGDAVFRRPGAAGNPIVIRGILVNGKRPVISGGTNTVHFRTDEIGSGADHYVMEGFEITGGTSRCVFHQSDDVTLRDLVVHDCPAHGILGADWGAGSLTVEHSEVYRCGGGDRLHQIYASADQDNYPDSVFRLQYSWIHDANGGNNVKSRAARNEIYYNRIEGAYYHELELIGSECCAENVVREDSDVVGNLFIKKGANASFYVTRFGGDGTGQSWGRYRFVNNTVVVSGTSAVFRLFDGLESLEMHNNVFSRSGGPVTILRTAEAVWASGEHIAGSNNWVTTGSTSLPTQWVGTLTGSSPGFANAAGGDYSPALGSPLLDAGNDTLSGPAGYPFPDPLFPPAFQPPGTPGVFGSPNPRPLDQRIDIGAYERGAGVSAQLSVADVSSTEGHSGATSAVFTVRLLPAASGTVTVSYSTANGTATAGSDYTATSGTLTFAAGETSKTVAVPVLGDTVDESNETFYLNLTGPTGATISDGQATGTIVDDDLPLPTLSIGDATVTEGQAGATSAAFTVSLSAASPQAVTVSYATANGTATAGSDYVAQAGNLTFTAGQTTKTIAVVVNGDTAVEPNETFAVNLASPVGATITDAQGQGTITNDDAAPSGELVSWVNVFGATPAAGSLTKTAPNAWGNAGASSTRAVNGNGSVEFTLPAAPGYAMFGLSNGDTDLGYADIDFAFYTYPPTGQLMVYEKGLRRAQLGAYAAGDMLRVAVESGVVKYWWKGALAYSSVQAPALPLRVDTSLYSTGASVQGATLAGALVDVALPTEPVAWQRAVGVSSTSTTLTKTAPAAWGNAGASSTRGFPSGATGYAEFTVPASPGYAMFGLSNGDTDQGYADIDFAFYTYPATGRLLVVEKGVSRLSVGIYAAGDKLHLSVSAGVVRYWWKGALVYTSPQAPVFPLRVDTSLYSTGAQVLGATLGGSLVATP